MPLKRNLVLAGLILAASAGFAQAQMVATTANDLEVRSGPGPQYPTVGMATRGSQAVLDGCIEGSRWCRVDVNGMRGWVYAQYLSVEQNGAPVVVEQHSVDLGVPTVTYEQTDNVNTGSVQQATPGPNDELLGPVEQGDQIETIAPPATVENGRAASRRGCPVDPRPRGPRPGLHPHRRRPRRGRPVRRRGHRRRAADPRPTGRPDAARRLNCPPKGGRFIHDFAASARFVDNFR